MINNLKSLNNSLSCSYDYSDEDNKKLTETLYDKINNILNKSETSSINSFDSETTTKNCETINELQSSLFNTNKINISKESSELNDNNDNISEYDSSINSNNNSKQNINNNNYFTFTLNRDNNIINNVNNNIKESDNNYDSFNNIIHQIDNEIINQKEKQLEFLKLKNDLDSIPKGDNNLFNIFNFRDINNIEELNNKHQEMLDYFEKKIEYEYSNSNTKTKNKSIKNNTKKELNTTCKKFFGISESKIKPNKNNDKENDCLKADPNTLFGKNNDRSNLKRELFLNIKNKINNI